MALNPGAIPMRDGFPKPASTVGSRVDAGWGEARTASRFAVPGRFLWLSDALVLFGAFLIAWLLSPHVQQVLSRAAAGPAPYLGWLSLTPAADASGLPRLLAVAWIPAVMVPVTLLFLHVLGGHHSLFEQSRTRIVLSSLTAPILGASVISLMLITVRDRWTSRSLVFGFVLLSATGFAAYRLALRSYKTRRLRSGAYARSVVVAASPGSRRALINHFQRRISSDLYALTGYLELPDAPRVADPDPDIAPLGTLQEFGDVLVHHPVDEVVAILSTGSEAWLAELVDLCAFFRVILRLIPEALLVHGPAELLLPFTGDPLGLPGVVLRPRYLDSEALFAKRVFDLIVSALLLLLLSPLFLLIAIAIKVTTPGLPVFYPWKVVGYKGRTFTGYKFTTMVADADQLKDDLQHLNEMTGPVFKIKDDPRITRLGKFLRKFSLNELPQLWSVVKGDMSLVGPRPAYPSELARYELWHKRKLCVQPGITCLWQIRGRNRISNFDDWVRMDFEYIDKWSLWLDCVILLRTIKVVLLGSGS